MAKEKSTAHVLAKNGSCAACGRAGAELAHGACPGYRTASELIKEWPTRKRRASTAPVVMKKAKKGGKKK